jgi:hypothetical protein
MIITAIFGEHGHMRMSLREKLSAGAGISRLSMASVYTPRQLLDPAKATDQHRNDN